MRDFNYSAIDWDSHNAEVRQRNGFPEVMKIAISHSLLNSQACIV